MCTLAVEKADRQMETMFGARITKTTPEERRLLRALAEVVDETGLAARADADAAAHLGVDSGTLSRPRQALIDKGLLEPAGYGKLRFSIPGFSRYLTRAVEDDG